MKIEKRKSIIHITREELSVIHNFLHLLAEADIPYSDLGDIVDELDDSTIIVWENGYEELVDFVVDFK